MCTVDRVCLCNLICFEILIGLAIIVVTIVYNYLLASFLISEQQILFFCQLMNFFLYGFQLILIFGAHNIICRHILCIGYSPCLYEILKIWLLISTLLVLCGIGTVWGICRSIDEMIAATETAMLNGIDDYYRDPDWKILWDKLQYHNQCCGVNSYKDWASATWIADVIEPTSCPTDLSYAPYTCCNRDCISCYEHFAPHIQSSESVNVLFINTCGCLSKYSQYLWHLVYINGTLIYIAILFQFIINFKTLSILKDEYLSVSKHNIQYACPPDVPIEVASTCTTPNSNTEYNDDVALCQAACESQFIH